MKKGYALRDCGERVDMKESPEYASIVANLEIALAEYIDVCQTPRGTCPNGCLSLRFEPANGTAATAVLLLAGLGEAVQLVDYLEDRIY